jgi:class 3 adenylate cyclase
MAQAETRKLAAIMFTDMVGFSRQMSSNEARMLRLLEVHNQLVRYAVDEHHGTVIKLMGDAFGEGCAPEPSAIDPLKRIGPSLRFRRAV